MKKIYQLIYDRAKQKGIKIEVNPNHRHNLDHTGSGRRNVKFPGAHKTYSYTDTLLNLGIRLGLITTTEADESYA